MPFPLLFRAPAACDGSSSQSWTYPSLNSIGPITSAPTGQCWATVLDNCAWGVGACIELRDKSRCGGGGAAQFNVTRGYNGTVIFIVASNVPAGTQGLCVDFNRDLNIVETYEW